LDRELPQRTRPGRDRSPDPHRPYRVGSAQPRARRPSPRRETIPAPESEGTGVELTIRLRGTFPDPTTARRVVEAVRADNPSFVSVEAEGTQNEIRLTA